MLPDSLATLGLPGRGYGIRYDYGMFKQNIVDGRQKESPDYWLEYGNPWEFKRHNTRYKVLFGGRIQQEGKKRAGLRRKRFWPSRMIRSSPVTTPTPLTHCGCGMRRPVVKSTSVNSTGATTLRRWKIKTTLRTFHGCSIRTIPPIPDESYACAEYFLVSATVQDILHRHYQLHKTYENLADKIAIHLNDTHPVLSIPELMRLLIDEHKFSWDDAFEVCCQVFSYTNHTLMSEALETRPVDMLGKILPRHLQIIFEINDYFLKTVQEQYPNDTSLLGRASIIDESNGRRVRMARLAVVVSHKVNGVSELHSNLMVQSLFADFAKIFPTRFCNVTNGVTPRRWLALANPPLSDVLDENIGRTWRTDLSQLSELKQHCDYPLVNHAVRQAKLENKNGWR